MGKITEKGKQIKLKLEKNREIYTKIRKREFKRRRVSQMKEDIKLWILSWEFKRDFVRQATLIYSYVSLITKFIFTSLKKIWDEIWKQIR